MIIKNFNILEFNNNKNILTKFNKTLTNNFTEIGKSYNKKQIKKEQISNSNYSLEFIVSNKQKQEMVDFINNNNYFLINSDTSFNVKVDSVYIYIKNNSDINNKVNFKKYDKDNRLFLLVNNKKMAFRYDTSYEIDENNEFRLVDEISNLYNNFHSKLEVNMLNLCILKDNSLKINFKKENLSELSFQVTEINSVINDIVIPRSYNSYNIFEEEFKEDIIKGYLLKNEINHWKDNYYVYTTIHHYNTISPDHNEYNEEGIENLYSTMLNFIIEHIILKEEENEFKFVDKIITSAKLNIPFSELFFENEFGIDNSNLGNYINLEQISKIISLKLFVNTNIINDSFITNFCYNTYTTINKHRTLSTCNINLFQTNINMDENDKVVILDVLNKVYQTTINSSKQIMTHIMNFKKYQFNYLHSNLLFNTRVEDNKILFFIYIDNKIKYIEYDLNNFTLIQEINTPNFLNVEVIEELPNNEFIDDFISKDKLNFLINNLYLDYIYYDNKSALQYILEDYNNNLDEKYYIYHSLFKSIIENNNKLIYKGMKIDNKNNDTPVEFYCYDLINNNKITYKRENNELFNITNSEVIEINDFYNLYNSFELSYTYVNIVNKQNTLYFNYFEDNNKKMNYSLDILNNSYYNNSIMLNNIKYITNTSNELIEIQNVNDLNNINFDNYQFFDTSNYEYQTNNLDKFKFFYNKDEEFYCFYTLKDSYSYDSFFPKFCFFKVINNEIFPLKENFDNFISGKKDGYYDNKILNTSLLKLEEDKFLIISEHNTDNVDYDGMHVFTTQVVKPFAELIEKKTLIKIRYGD